MLESDNTENTFSSLQQLWVVTIVISISLLSTLRPRKAKLAG